MNKNRRPTALKKREQEKPRGNFSLDTRAILPPNWKEIHNRSIWSRLSNNDMPRLHDVKDLWKALSIIPALILGAQNTKDLAGRILAALVAGTLAILLNSALISTHAFDLFWEPVSSKFGEGLVVLPMFLAAFFSGSVIGTILGLIYRRYPVRLAFCVALLTILCSGIILLPGVVSLTQGQQTWILITSCSVPVGIYFGAIATEKVYKS